MTAVDFPIGEKLKRIIGVEYNGFSGHDLTFEQIQLQFASTTIVLSVDVDTDELLISQSKPVPANFNSTKLFDDLVGKKLQTLWHCENSQGYFDQIIFAFDTLQPAFSILAEGAVLKLFRFEPLLKNTVKPALIAVGKNGN
jgi:Family of unknown function (DUF6334)